MNYQNITMYVYKKVPKSKTKRGVIQRAMRNGSIHSIAKDQGLNKRQVRRYLSIAYKEGKLNGY